MPAKVHKCNIDPIRQKNGLGGIGEDRKMKKEKREKEKADLIKAGNAEGTKFLMSKDNKTVIDLENGLFLFNN